MSGGRLILGIGAGWYDREYQAYGWEYPADRDRLQLLREACEVIPRLWSEETVSYQGKHLTFDDAYCDPKPLRSPRPPILIGGGGEKVTLRIEAQHADLTNWQVGIEAFRRKSGLLEQYCDEIGRDFASITRTHGPDCRVFDSEADLKKWLDSPGGGSLWGRGDPVEYVRDNFVGTVEQHADKPHTAADRGRRSSPRARDAPGTARCADRGCTADDASRSPNGKSRPAGFPREKPGPSASANRGRPACAAPNIPSAACPTNKTPRGASW
jgi:alkanesulfonate monooxygenase SsuD/methylene tetrahydromethanopterin reductase-like flavin-dependent oxidoreductase (luciferase family)